MCQERAYGEFFTGLRKPKVAIITDHFQDGYLYHFIVLLRININDEHLCGHTGHTTDN